MNSLCCRCWIGDGRSRIDAAVLTFQKPMVSTSVGILIAGLALREKASGFIFAPDAGLMDLQVADHLSFNLSEAIQPSN